MTVTGLGWQEALAAVKVLRPCAGPNRGFQQQLQVFEATQAKQVSARNWRECTISVLHFVCFFYKLFFLQFREWLQNEYKDNPFNDEADLRELLAKMTKADGESVEKKACTPPGGI